MPQTFGEIIQKQDLLHPFEEQIKDALLYSNEHDTLLLILMSYLLSIKLQHNIKTDLLKLNSQN